MTDADLVSALHSLGVDEESVAAVALLPLVEVAWADGRVQPAERAEILELARARGLLDGEGQRLVETWLRYRPSESYLHRGRDVLRSLADRGDHPTVNQATLTEIVALCNRVATAAGGLLGRLGAFDPREQEIVAEIAEAFTARRATWDEVMGGMPAPGLMRDGAFPDNDDLTDPFPDDNDVTNPFPMGSPSSSPLPRPPLIQLRSRRPSAPPPPPAAVTESSVEEFEEDRPRPALLLQAVPGSQSVPHAVTGRGLSLGRRSDCDVCISDDAHVSRLHARIFRQAGRVYVVDCASTHGTWVMEERIHERRLFGGEELRVGETRFQFLFGMLKG